MSLYNKICLLVICLLCVPQIAFAQDKLDLKSEIYSKLRDRRCNMPLDKCNWPDAREMKSYIDALIETGIGKDDIFYKVAKKFSLNLILDKQVKEIIEKRLLDELGSNRPEIIIEPTSFDFGNVSKKQGKISSVFKLTNRGKVPLIIKNLKTLCPCTLVSLRVGKSKSPYFKTEGASADWQMEIKPNNAGDLEVVLDLLDPHANLGGMVRDILIVSNDPIYPEVTVQIRVFVTD